MTIAGLFDLQDSELEVLQLVFDAYGDPDIAHHLHRSRHTVHTHVKARYLKLGVRPRTELLVRTMTE